MKLTGKTRNEIAATLAGMDREALLDLIFSLVNFERMLTAAQIARAEQCEKRTVLADMKAGRFIDPIFGPGFFCRAANSFRVSVSAANAWRHSFFVSARRRDRGRASDSIPLEKNNRAGSDNDLAGENPRQSAEVFAGTGAGIGPDFEEGS